MGSTGVNIDSIYNPWLTRGSLEGVIIWSLPRDDTNYWIFSHSNRGGEWVNCGIKLEAALDGCLQWKYHNRPVFTRVGSAQPFPPVLPWESMFSLVACKHVYTTYTLLLFLHPCARFTFSRGKRQNIYDHTRLPSKRCYSISRRASFSIFRVIYRISSFQIQNFFLHFRESFRPIFLVWIEFSSSRCEMRSLLNRFSRSPELQKVNALGNRWKRLFLERTMFRMAKRAVEAIRIRIQKER